MVQAAPSASTATANPVPDAGHPSQPSRLLSKHRPRRRAAPPRPTLPPPAPTRCQPDLNRCHCCFVRFQPPAPGANRHPIRPLRSVWRIVLLCSECISLLRSGAVCSYCLSLNNLPHEDSSVTCRSCNCRVHHYCIPDEHRTALIQPVDLENFVCVDCCPTVKVGSKNAVAKSVPKLELVVWEPNSAGRRRGESVAVAKLNSPRKVVEEVKPASKCAKDSMAIVPVGEVSESKGLGDPDLPDKALALQLHLMINGSPRISRSGSASGLVSAGQGKGKNGLASRRKVKEDLGLCVTNMMDHVDYHETGAEMRSNWNANHVLGFDPSATVVLALECTGKHPQESTRDKRKGPPGTEEHNSLVEWHKVDRYAKKYSKRKSSKQADIGSTGKKTSPSGKDMDVHEGGEGITPMT